MGSSINHHRRGSGTPLLLVHGLGAEWQQWAPVLDALGRHRELVAVDLPGFGASPPLAGEVTPGALADAVAAFLAEQDLTGTDVVGSSLGGQVALELARRGTVGDVVALDPTGFWTPGRRRLFGVMLAASFVLVRVLRPVLPALLGNRVARTVLLAGISARPWALPPDLALANLRAVTRATSLWPALRALLRDPGQQGAPAGTTPGRVTIGWGRQDRIILPRQAALAEEAFPGAQMTWFERCGHLPHADQPQQTVDLVLARTGPQ